MCWLPSRSPSPESDSGFDPSLSGHNSRSSDTREELGIMTQSGSIASEQPEDRSGGSTNGLTDFSPFSEERARIERITTRLDETTDLTERADLGSELVRSVSRYEDTFERAILPRVQDLGPTVLDQLEDDREQLRVAMEDIHHRTMGIDPRNVHASDGQGFEDTLEVVVIKVRSIMAAEDRLIANLVESLGTHERSQLAEDVNHTFKSASERPRPPRTAVGRFLSNAHVKLDHTLEDVSTPRHPGSDTING
jgi:hypothetical protein